MPRPKDKQTLQKASAENFSALFTFIDSLPTERQEKEFPTGTMNRNISDVLMHVHHWHLMFLQWYYCGLDGKKPIIPCEGYTWKTTPMLNKMIWEKYQNTPFHKAKEHIIQTHHIINAIIALHEDDALFTNSVFAWTGSTTLGAYLVSATSSHYIWALRLIKRANKGVK